jgi:hypothetical protein
MTVEQVITLITLIVGLIGAIAALVPTLIKLFKTIKELVENKNWAALTKIAMSAMRDVEVEYKKNPNMSSQEKLDMAIEIIQSSAAQMGVEVTDELIDNLVKYINDTIKWANDMKK